MSDVAFRRIVWRMSLLGGYRVELNRPATDQEVTRAILEAAANAVEDREAVIAAEARLLGREEEQG